eukprot:757383-Hanusia_phi.AAC.4
MAEQQRCELSPGPPTRTSAMLFPSGSKEWTATTYDNGTKRFEVFEPPDSLSLFQGFPHNSVCRTSFAFGRNNYAQLGVGDYVDRRVPTPLATVYARISKLRCDVSHASRDSLIDTSGGAQSCILQWQGPNSLYSWGRDDHGQLGQVAEQLRASRRVDDSCGRGHTTTIHFRMRCSRFQSLH